MDAEPYAHDDGLFLRFLLLPLSPDDLVLKEENRHSAREKDNCGAPDRLSLKDKQDGVNCLKEHLP